jgi:hypothetical protein
MSYQRDTGSSYAEEERARVLREGLTETDKRYEPPLHFAACEGDVPTARNLLARGVDVNGLDHPKRRPLDYALHGDRQAVFAMMALSVMGMDRNAETGRHEVDSVDKDGGERTALHCAAMFNRVEMIRVLVYRGAEKEHQSLDGFRPLHLAAALGHAEAVRMLGELGADLEAHTSRGETPLQLSVLNGHDDKVGPVLRQLERARMEAIHAREAADRVAAEIIEDEERDKAECKLRAEHEAAAQSKAKGKGKATMGGKGGGGGGPSGKAAASAAGSSGQASSSQGSGRPGSSGLHTTQDAMQAALSVAEATSGTQQPHSQPQPAGGGKKDKERQRKERQKQRKAEEAKEALDTAMAAMQGGGARCVRPAPSPHCMQRMWLLPCVLTFRGRVLAARSRWQRRRRLWRKRRSTHLAARRWQRWWRRLGPCSSRRRRSRRQQLRSDCRWRRRQRRLR